jgi:O-antigen/teichoic acid export membrane protein
MIEPLPLPPAERAGRTLLSGTVGTALLQGTARGLGFVSTLILASVMGAAGYGAYAWVIAWVFILRIPVSLGQDRLLVRQVAAYAARREWGLLSGVLRHSRWLVLTGSVGFTGVAIVVVSLISPALDSPLVSALQVGLVLLPIVALTALAQGALQGLHRVVAAQVPDAVVRPLLFIAMLGLGALFFGHDWTPESALLLQAAASAVGLFATVRLRRKHLPRVVSSSVPRSAARTWNRAGLTMAANSGLNAVHQRIDLILVGGILGATSAGVYGVASAAAVLASTATRALTLPLNPVVARLHAEGDSDRLAKTIKGATRAAFAATFVLTAGLALGGRIGLGVFGDAFLRGTGALALLCLAVLINAAFVTNTSVLVMTGHERAATVATGVGAVLSAILCIIMIPAWGLTGAGLATVLSMLVRNALASYFTWNRLGLDTTIAGVRSRPRAAAATGSASG